MDCVVTVCDEKRRFLDTLFHPPLCITIPNGATDQRANGTTPAATSRPYCLFVGDASKGKGLHYLLQAVAKSRYAGSLTVKAAGHVTPEEQRLLTRAHTDVDVQFLGLVAAEEMQELYVGSLFCTLPSMHEQCSYAAIEMMMHGKAVIATRTEGLREMFRDGENCLAVPVRLEQGIEPRLDTDVFAAHINTLMENPALRLAIGGRAREDYLARYTAEAMADAIQDLYHILWNDET